MKVELNDDNVMLIMEQLCYHRDICGELIIKNEADGEDLRFSFIEGDTFVALKDMEESSSFLINLLQALRVDACIAKLK